MSNDDYAKARAVMDGPDDQFAQAERAGYNPHAQPTPTVKPNLITITSFGYLHSEPPTADVTIDLRDFFRDPHIDPRLKYMSARDQEVVDKVLSTAGVRKSAESLTTVLARLADGAEVTVALGCAGGRHRAPAISDYAATLLTAGGYQVEVTHRDLDKPVVERGGCRG
jgi:RNase adaptor protein for sRNA GlmZ degradation